MSDGAKYAPPGPNAEAAIEVEIQRLDGRVYFRIPFSALSMAFGTSSDRREDMVRTFIDRKCGVWPKLCRKAPSMWAGQLYTVTAQDLS